MLLHLSFSVLNQLTECMSVAVWAAPGIGIYLSLRAHPAITETLPIALQAHRPKPVDTMAFTRSRSLCIYCAINWTKYAVHPLLSALLRQLQSVVFGLRRAADYLAPGISIIVRLAHSAELHSSLLRPRQMPYQPVRETTITGGLIQISFFDILDYSTGFRSLVGRGSAISGIPLSAQNRLRQTELMLEAANNIKTAASDLRYIYIWNISDAFSGYSLRQISKFPPLVQIYSRLGLPIDLKQRQLVRKQLILLLLARAYTHSLCIR